ncbi:hypothetical protein BT96DRAFT_1005050 [Gymnopus androsaceus JB14]|uniref:Band 7 domain-containing protein n=1 Tax=Gymnopus androsaceus JB14 TaxID=1447944 RepID=A0A6A4GQQ7_9AGAR|nr:hypothetical protein BT96DRAFT_1005050 [Gymnopus androsaceus JB14]
MSLLTTGTRTALRASSRSVLGPQLARTFFTIIEQGREGWRLSLGRSPVKLNPGINFNIPIYHSVQVVDLRESSISIPKLPGYTSDNCVPALYSIELWMGIRACFSVSDVLKNIENTGTSAMRAVLGQFSYDQVISDRNGLNDQLNAVIGGTISNWGIECTRFEIQSFQPANREVEVSNSKLQMEAERNRRKQLLDTQAQINIAEGQKQRVILESEGHLEAKSNEADASFKTVVREAEARQQQAIMEASALAKQVSKLAFSISAELLTHWLSFGDFEQLKAIAQGSGNSTYFFGEKPIFGKGNENGVAYGVDFAEQTKAFAKSVSGGH